MVGVFSCKWCWILLTLHVFSEGQRENSFGKPSGFNAWRKLNPRLLEHEHSSYHLSTFTVWKEFEMWLQKQETIDAAVQLAQQRSFEKWKAILARILDCVLYLARQTLPLHGHSEDLSTGGNWKFPTNFQDTCQIWPSCQSASSQSSVDRWLHCVLSLSTEPEWVHQPPWWSH